MNASQVYRDLSCRGTSCPRCGGYGQRDARTPFRNAVVNFIRSQMMLLKTLVSIALAISVANVATAQTFKERATCKLTNTAANKTLYEGPCKVTQSMSGNNTIFSVKMDKSEPFMFAGVRGQKNWMHGPEETQFTDLPNGGIFRWSNFALVVAE
jgi:hypothetical protein